MAYRLRVRKFLNRIGHHSGAYILAEVQDSTRHREDELGWPYPDINLTLADCGRVVSFAFDVDTAAGRSNSLRKIDILIDTLVRFRVAVEEEAELAAGRRRSGQQ